MRRMILIDSNSGYFTFFQKRRPRILLKLLFVCFCLCLCSLLYNHNLKRIFSTTSLKNERYYSPQELINLDRAHKKTVPKNSTLEKCEGSKIRRPVTVVVASVKNIFAIDVVKQLLKTHPDTDVTEEAIFEKSPENFFKYIPCTKRGSLTVDVSSSYLTNVNIPKKIYKYNPDMKIVIVLRNPLERLISHYLMLLRNEQTNKTLEELVCTNNKSSPINTKMNIVRDSMYEVHMGRWLKYFPLKNMLFITQKTIVMLPFRILRSLEQHLHIHPFIERFMLEINSERSYFKLGFFSEEKDIYRSIDGNQYGNMFKDCKEKLETFIKYENRVLFKIIKQTYPYWL